MTIQKEQDAIQKNRQDMMQLQSRKTDLLKDIQAIDFHIEYLRKQNAALQATIGFYKKKTK